jgi:hypothetical protein
VRVFFFYRFVVTGMPNSFVPLLSSKIDFVDTKIFHKGDCDDSIVTLAQLMGWEDELYELNAKTKVKTDNKNEKSKKQDKKKE